MSKQKHLLDNEQFGEQIDEIKQYLTSHNVDLNNNNSYTSKTGLFGMIFGVTPIYAYDLPELVKAYPTAFHTENALFVSTKTLEGFNNSAELLYHGDMKYPIIRMQMTNMLLDMIEHNYQHNFSDEQRVKLLEDNISGASGNIDVSSLPARIEFISAKKLSKVVKPAGVDTDFKELLGSQFDTLNQVLFSLPQTHNVNHPFNAISEKVVNSVVGHSITNLNPSIEEFNRYYQDGMSADNKAYAQHVLNSQIEKVQAVALSSKSDSEAILASVKENVVPYLNHLNDDTFANVISNIKIVLNSQDMPNVWTHDFKVKLATIINDEVGSEKRSSMIKIVSDFNTEISLGLQPRH